MGLYETLPACPLPFPSIVEWLPELTMLFLGSLCCDSADECKTMIPSLADKISDEDLQELLDEMAKLMTN